jgi:hypothetical protein
MYGGGCTDQGQHGDIMIRGMERKPLPSTTKMVPGSQQFFSRHIDFDFSGRDATF